LECSDKHGRPAREETQPWSLSSWARRRSASIIDPIARCLAGLGIRPNFLTVVGFVVSLVAGFAVAKGKLWAGGWLFLVSGLFDALDGSVARITGNESSFGAFLDSFLDRYSEAALLFGILFWSTFQGRHALVLLVFVTLTGSIMVSYARARAEGLNIPCKVGFFTRLERFVVLAMMLLTGQLLVGLSILALLTNMTALQRMFHVYKKSTQ
jgi:CDP-diacylglycerol--glycerol-3-phosphate 3-phosphatidyltransferase